ncbi:hypothetical protein RGF97_26680 [Streptomyces roseicoloratus]|uniref:Uncharacterized protein n=1 Tax=Streptomyces roseicoloratus TaxID=2508722 RepID=A0ABY9S0W1_9ACTN|nr:hypothetical protein [Streptomyces roseicoloratus]WMX47674.1 hypothetical protein RGF97_26680 [Streptomyces roseicoloratus]
MTRPTSARRLLRVPAILACLPYLTLEVLWVTGGEAGGPGGSILLEHRGAMAAVDAASVPADAVVVLLALLPTQAWGRRVTAWLPGCGGGVAVARPGWRPGPPAAGSPLCRWWRCCHRGRPPRSRRP